MSCTCFGITKISMKHYCIPRTHIHHKSFDVGFGRIPRHKTTKSLHEKKGRAHGLPCTTGQLTFHSPIRKIYKYMLWIDYNSFST
ncbi:hypothetical protein COCNU_04G014500 [Cocos nucifera]|uniref:Uncharacterized protein n=1 Tax=Cocos nucifera TaxID=13894 RepID=A0A8K0I7P1_COCNU|nr:hypothetical protein COCNU_04G014500 [Cocos nucifera]